MLEQIFRSPTVRARLHNSYLSTSIDVYVTYLEERGFTQRSIQSYLWAVEHFSRWLERKGVDEAGVTSHHVKLFLYNHLPRCRCTPPALRCINMVRAALRHWCIVTGRKAEPSQGVTPSRQIIAAVEAYDRYLDQVAGLAESTRQYRRRYVLELMTALFKKRRLDFRVLTPAAIVKYVTGRAHGLRPSSVRVMALSLRSYLKFLRFSGEVHAAAPEAIPKTPNWRLSSLPTTFDEQQIKNLLVAFDRRTSVGRRDYAMARCLVDLGLRTCEVANLTLDDIDWRQGTIAIARNKSHRINLLPLPAATGMAIVAYLRKGRPTTPVRFLFVHHRAPLGQGVAPSTVRGVIRQAYQRAGFALQRVHVLRHTAATRMLRRGASLKDIADVLGHRCLDSTAIYAKVDVEKLTEVALPWPGRSADGDVRSRLPDTASSTGVRAKNRRGRIAALCPFRRRTRTGGSRHDRAGTGVGDLLAQGLSLGMGTAA